MSFRSTQYYITKLRDEITYTPVYDNVVDEEEEYGEDESGFSRTRGVSDAGRGLLRPADKSTSSMFSSVFKGANEEDQSLLRSRDYSNMLHPLPKEVGG